MKSRKTFVAILAGMIFSLHITGCGNSNRHNDVQSIQTKDAKDSKSLTVISTKHTVAPPVTESHPVAETEPVVKTTPVTEAVMGKETDASKQTTEEIKRTVNKQFTPSAIPVVTPEEAEKRNAFAIFLSTVKTTVVEGEIIERSELPDPQQSDYPNCRFTAHFSGNSIKSGEPCPKELALIIEGFNDYKILKNNELRTGDKVQCRVLPFESLPEEFQSTQQADDLNLFLLENYYVVDIRNINSYSDDSFLPKSGIFFSEGNEDYVSVFERHINPPIPQSIIDAQKTSIQKDLQRMNQLLAPYNDENGIEEINALFTNAWNQEKGKDSNGYNRVRGYVWRNIDNSFWCLPDSYTLLSKPDMLTRESLDAFAALKKACEANGVQLIVTLVPELNVIAARVINKDFRDIADIQTATFVKQLSEIGVETIYPSDAIIKNYNRYPFAFFYPGNGHPSDTAQDVITDILAERLARYHVSPNLDSKLFSEKQSPHVYGDDERYLFPEKCDIEKNDAGTPYTNREILYDGKPVPLSKDAPIITIGNSYQQTPMNYPDTIPTLLSYKLNSTIDWYRIGGRGPFSDIMMQFLTRADFFLKNKKVLILYIGTTHLNVVNNSDNILNIALLDKTRVILNNRKNIFHFVPASNTEDNSFRDDKIWGSLSTMDKSCFTIKESGKSLFSYRFDQDNSITIDDSKKILCIVPTACLPGTVCKLYINDQSQTIPSFNSRYESKFFSISFELPAGTREITIKAEGKPGTMFAIKDIQIWQ